MQKQSLKIKDEEARTLDVNQDTIEDLNNFNTNQIFKNKKENSDNKVSYETISSLHIHQTNNQTPVSIDANLLADINLNKKN